MSKATCRLLLGYYCARAWSIHFFFFVYWNQSNWQGFNVFDWILTDQCVQQWIEWKENKTEEEEEEEEEEAEISKVKQRNDRIITEKRRWWSKRTDIIGGFKSEQHHAWPIDIRAIFESLIDKKKNLLTLRPINFSDRFFFVIVIIDVNEMKKKIIVFVFDKNDSNDIYRFGFVRFRIEIEKGTSNDRFRFYFCFQEKEKHNTTICG